MHDQDGWEPRIAVDEGGARPLYLRISDALRRDVRRGRLRPGQRLPGSRTLADDLGVHRNTVLAALDELSAQGWIVRVPARGTFIASDLPPATPGRAGAATSSHALTPGFDLPREARGPSERYRRARRDEPQPGTLMLAGGLPDTRLVPADLLARAYRRALRRSAREVLSYGDPRGSLRLRQAIAQMLAATRGVVAAPEALLVTRGAQMGLHLVGQLLGRSPRGARERPVIAVERYGYPPAWEALASGGAELVPLPVDAHGLDVEALAALAESRPVRAVYLTPHHQYPTTVPLAPARRLRLLELAARRRMAVIEDDYDHEFHFSGAPLLPLASADERGVVLYVGTLSKIFAPGLRIAWVVATPQVIERLARLRLGIDRQGDLAVEHAVAELLEDGEVARHARRMRRVYSERRAVLQAALSRELAEVLSYELPAGGLALWCRARGVDVDAWCQRAAELGARFDPASSFLFSSGRRPYVRLGFAPLDEVEIDEAIRRVACALRPRRLR
ncbi:MAG: PLP-dependent aminotransferase family protein [Myxococcales bacterium]|nr:PLP-dependent aminotransferase family protein [Myxococcales bacterium]